MPAVAEVPSAVAENLLPVTDFLLPRANAGGDVAPRNGQENEWITPKTRYLKAETEKITSILITVAEVADFLHNVELAHGLPSWTAFCHVKYVKIPEVLSTFKSLLLLLPTQLDSQNGGKTQ